MTFSKTTEEYYYNGKYPEKWNKYRGGAFYHGRGLLQITHIENYAKYFGVNTKDLTKEMVESKLLKIYNTVDSSGCFWVKGSAWGDIRPFASKNDSISCNDLSKWWLQSFVREKK
ncbi:hypothetical protein O9992_29340 [Vibrio lentus]|nr:hypothetical protein [Vibrio lentus]